MDIKLIVAFILVGLVCYIIGRLSARRGQNSDGQMLQTSALRNFNGPDSLNIGDSGTAALDSATLQEIEKLLRKRAKNLGHQDLSQAGKLRIVRSEGRGRVNDEDILTSEKFKDAQVKLFARAGRFREHV